MHDHERQEFATKVCVLFGFASRVFEGFLMKQEIPKGG